MFGLKDKDSLIFIARETAFGNETFLIVKKQNKVSLKNKETTATRKGRKKRRKSLYVKGGA